MYDPTIGRWISQDPIGFEAGDANLYRYVQNRPTLATDPSGLLESDDRDNAPGNRRLVNVDGILERHVNAIIDQERSALELLLRPVDRNDDTTRYQRAMEAVQAVYRRLGRNVRGSGVDAGWPAGSRSQITEIEKWLKDNLRSPANEINQVTFLQSRYRFNLVGHSSASNAPWLYVTTNINVLNHAIAPTIRVNGTLMGTDKWGHFFQQGFWLFDSNMRNELLTEDSRLACSQFMEGNYNPRVRPVGEASRFGSALRRYGFSAGVFQDTAGLFGGV